MPMKTVKKLCFLGLSIFLVFGSVWAVQNDGSHRLYLEAKKHSFQQEWSAAAQLFQQLVKEYPKSHYHEEAQFWVGYCLEKSGETKDAFDAFVKLEKMYPNSLWVDDAVMHRIVLAEKLAQKRGDRYYFFLREKLEHEDKDIQYQAAMALGRLGDKKALPVIYALRGQVDFDDETNQVITSLENMKDIPDEIYMADNAIGEVNEDFDRDHDKDVKINYFPEQRFEQYRKMTRTDDKWSQADLESFGLWHILPTQKFDEFLKLKSEEKSEWLRIFWKKYDPTPTTAENENQDEFNRRIEFARSHYTYFDNLPGFYYAPWDARGEVYIKFGQPEERQKSDDGEFWTYPQLQRVTFYIRPNVTNIFGRAISISSLNNWSIRSRTSTSDWLRARNFHNKYIFSPGFYYVYNDGNDQIIDFIVKVIPSNDIGLVFRYKMPINEFDIQAKDGLYHLNYLERYVVFNNKMNEVARHETKRQITKPNKNDFKKLQTIEEEIRVDLEPGDYTLGLRIEDTFSKKIAIRKVDISVKSR